MLLGSNASRILFSPRMLNRRSILLNLQPKKMEGPGDDFRPPWVYVGTRLISFAVIPAVASYAVFFYDFGDHEHVFQPPRRWAANRINSFFMLSSEEEKMLQRGHQSSPSSTSKP